MERWAKREKCQAIRGGRYQTGSKRSKRHRQKCSFPSWHKNSVVFLKDNFKCQRSHQTEHQFRPANTGGARFLLGEIKDWQFGWLRMLGKICEDSPSDRKENGCIGRLWPFTEEASVHSEGVKPHWLFPLSEWPKIFGKGSRDLTKSYGKKRKMGLILAKPHE